MMFNNGHDESDLIKRIGQCSGGLEEDAEGVVLRKPAMDINVKRVGSEETRWTKKPDYAIITSDDNDCEPMPQPSGEIPEREESCG